MSLQDRSEQEVQTMDDENAWSARLPSPASETHLKRLSLQRSVKLFLQSQLDVPFPPEIMVSFKTQTYSCEHLTYLDDQTSLFVVGDGGEDIWWSAQTTISELPGSPTMATGCSSWLMLCRATI